MPRGFGVVLLGDKMKPEIDTMKVITYDDEKKFILRLSDIIADYQHKKLEVEVQYSFYNGLVHRIGDGEKIIIKGLFYDSRHNYCSGLVFNHCYSYIRRKERPRYSGFLVKIF